MKKIFNWTFGSIFRTFGRIIAYIIIGAIAVILFSGHIKTPKISNILNDILFMKVNASTTYAFFHNEVFYSRNTLLTYDQYAQMYKSNNFFNYTDMYGVLKFGSDRLDISSATSKPASAIFTIKIPFVEDEHNFNGSVSCTNTILHNTTTQPDGTYATNYYPNSTTCTFTGENWNLNNYSYTISAYLHSSNSANTISGWLPCHIDINGVMSEGAFNYFNLTCPMWDGATYLDELKIYSDNSYGSGFLISPDFGITKDNSDDTITNAISNQTNNIVNSQNQNAQNIINNQNQNNQAVINNQNANTNATIENQNQNTQATIDSQKVCQYIDKSNIKESNKYLYIDGSYINSNNWGITDYINIINSDITRVNDYNTTTSSYLCFYNTNKSIISCLNNENIPENITIPSGSTYVRFSINVNTNKPTFKICQNGNQAMANTITDESGPSNISSLSNENMVGWLPPGPVDSLINLPLVLLNSLQNALSSTCSPITLTLPFVNQDIYLPCMSSLYEEMGVSSFVNWAGIVASAFILFSYLMRFYKWVDNTLTFRENNWLDNWGGE